LAMGLIAAAALTGCKQREAKIGDTIIVYFEGFMDGVQFDGGTGTAPLTLGSGQFIPGFEEQMLGAKKGETREVNVVFPETYGEPSLAGKPAVFKVSVKEFR